AGVRIAGGRGSDDHTRPREFDVRSHNATRAAGTTRRGVAEAALSPRRFDDEASRRVPAAAARPASRDHASAGGNCVVLDDPTLVADKLAACRVAALHLPTHRMAARRLVTSRIVTDTSRLRIELPLAALGNLVRRCAARARARGVGLARSR